MCHIKIRGAFKTYHIFAGAFGASTLWVRRTSIGSTVPESKNRHKIDFVTIFF